MASNVKGPAIFLAQFAGDEAPFNSFNSICRWAAGHGYEGVQLPDMGRAADRPRQGGFIESLLRRARRRRRVARDRDHRALHPFAGPARGGEPGLRRGVRRLRAAAGPGKLEGPPGVGGRPDAAGREGLAEPGARCLGVIHRRARMALRLSMAPAPGWPDRDRVRGTRDAGRRSWNAYDAVGVDVCYEIHPGEDVFDGATFEMFLDARGAATALQHQLRPSHFLLQQLDYLAFIDIYHERIKAFHVKDAEFNPDGRQGVYSGYQPWINRAGRFRSLGDGQVDFGGIFSKMAQYGYRRLGRAGVGMRHQASRGRRARRGGVHQEPPDPRHREGLRRLRGRVRGQGADQPASRAGLKAR